MAINWSWQKSQKNLNNSWLNDLQILILLQDSQNRQVLTLTSVFITYYDVNGCFRDKWPPEAIVEMLVMEKNQNYDFPSHSSYLS